MENYEQKYKEALERARKINSREGVAAPSDWTICEVIFPELRESEDERIRKALIRNFTNQHSSNFPTADGFTREQILAWLEKQGEQKHADKFESKFKVGDWIVNNNGEPRVFRVEKQGWPDSIISSSLGNQFINTFTLDKQYHLWTIEDANDGDVLATKKGNPFIYDKDRYNNGLAYYYAGLDVNKELTLKSPHHMLAHFGELCSIFPATKEQRDLLFQKMKEAGYEWNAEKKELNKIEKQSEQIHAEWSEDDEKLYNSALWHIKNSCGNGGKDSGEYEVYNWLKSIKDRVQPQPKQEWSEEDEDALDIAIRIIQNGGDDCAGILDSNKALKWLKSIKLNYWKPSEQNIKDLEWCAGLVKDKMGIGFHRLQVFIYELKQL